MFKDYFFRDNATVEEETERHKRIIAMEAAYEIAKASVGSVGAGTQSKVAADLKAVASSIDELADAIQAALEK
ncbi:MULTISPECIES: hypothetical protein [Pantoea]|uniref:hypothetical protein n=1 Tax=Pantoea TaxID=53335 RepID=UPI000EA2AF7D|nr:MULTISPECIES: hypothetical protein [Pantoea]MBZ6385519.1 hypothetical protein [Pantoea piersonii]MBZ6398937.1 hypothetical protein [Pantoea piersonii]MBZ6407565.1 hypothetical protein [Pantoea piersonii]MBZ6425484.1 hypothetical protein [Pantoea piersonii]NYB00993.1 hypothetical protein [Pantoea piersonii]